MYEGHTKRPLSFRDFLKRLWFHVLAALLFTTLSLLIGMVGYKYFETMNWTDAFLNASMILGGMGEVDPLKTEGGKLFAGCYALYSGLWVIACMGLIIAPVFHRILHKFHAGK